MILVILGCQQGQVKKFPLPVTGIQISSGRIYIRALPFQTLIISKTLDENRGRR